MEVSTNQEPNMVKNYYNRTRGNIQVKKKANQLNAALASLKRRRGHRTGVRSPLHPLSEKEAEERREVSETDINESKMKKSINDPYNHLTKEEIELLKQARGHGGRRTRRHRGRRRR
jgi:hypothetical protein